MSVCGGVGVAGCVRTRVRVHVCARQDSCERSNVFESVSELNAFLCSNVRVRVSVREFIWVRVNVGINRCET